MSLYDKLDSDTKTAMKKGDQLKVTTLRMTISAAKMVQIEKNLKSIDDDTVIAILQKQVKQHKESIEQFEKGSRADLADKEKAELKILEEYLPKQLEADELTEIIKQTISEINASTKNDTGRVMKAVLEKVKGKSDGKTVSTLVQQFLK